MTSNFYLFLSWGFRVWGLLDLESRSPNLGPDTTKGTLEEPPLRDLLFRSSRGSGIRSFGFPLGFGF